MFERYDEAARRTLFFARYEVTHLGGTSINSEHILLGLLRGGHGGARRVLFKQNISPDDLRREVKLRIRAQEPKLSRSVEIPFGDDAKRALQYAAEEADRMRSKGIGTEHLLLGLMRDGQSVAGSILAKRLRLDETRSLVERFAENSAPESTDSDAIARDLLRFSMVSQIDEVIRMVRDLVAAPAASPDRFERAQMIVETLESMKNQIDE